MEGKARTVAASRNCRQGAFTDSGYAFAPGEQPDTQLSDLCGLSTYIGNDVRKLSMREDDAGTCYTASSTKGMFNQVYIQEFANDIYRKLQLDKSTKEWEAPSQDAPKFLKAFAIKIKNSSDLCVRA